MQILYLIVIYFINLSYHDNSTVKSRVICSLRPTFNINEMNGNDDECSVIMVYWWGNSLAVKFVGICVTTNNKN